MERLLQPLVDGIRTPIRTPWEWLAQVCISLSLILQPGFLLNIEQIIWSTEKLNPWEMSRGWRRRGYSPHTCPARIEGGVRPQPAPEEEEGYCQARRGWRGSTNVDNFSPPLPPPPLPPQPESSMVLGGLLSACWWMSSNASLWRWRSASLGQQEKIPCQRQD